MAIFLSLFIWMRATLLRIRYDQLMRFSWGVLFPVALLWFLATAFYVAQGGGVA
jgi:NADH-quinone oxidoreductase subunit H